MGLVDRHQRGVPVLARSIDQGAEKCRDRDHLVLALAIGQVEQNGEAVRADALGGRGE